MFSLSISVFPVGIIPQCSIFVSILIPVLLGGQRLEASIPKCTMIFWVSGSTGISCSLLHKYLTVLFEVCSPCDNKIIAEIYSKGIFSKLYVLLIVHPCIILYIEPTWCKIFLSMFISFHYMFRATMCPSWGKITIFVTLDTCHSVWMTVWYVPSDKYQVWHRYSYFSWLWAHRRPKHVMKRYKHTKKHFAPSWFYLQGYSASWHIVDSHSVWRQECYRIMCQSCLRH